MKTLWALLILGLTATSHADVVTLKTGAKLTGTLVSYGEATFELRLTDGQIKRLEATNVSRIEFSPRLTRSVLQTTAQGKVEGKLTTYEDSMFNIETTGGGSIGLAGDMVTTGDFAYRGTSTGTPTRPGETAPLVKKVAVITHGNPVTLSKHIVSGKVTIVDFYADWCGPCRQLAPFLEDMVKNDPDLVMRKIDIVDWNTAVAKQFAINSIPRVQVYGRDGNLVGTSGSNTDTIRKLVAKAKAGGS